MKIKLRLFIIFLIVTIVPSLVLYINSKTRCEHIDKLLISSISIIIGMGFFMTYWLYTHIFSPLINLGEAVRQITEGNLDFALEFDAYDEIGELSRNFEEMRIRLRQNEEQKLLADKNNKELISNISHDLKTPITAIKGYVEGIMDGVASSPEKIDKYIRTIYNKANDMDKLIDELTFYSKIDTNGIPYNYKVISVVDFFTDCAKEVGLDMESMNIDFYFNNNVDMDTFIVADVEQMKRVVNNIISNSVKYMDKNDPKIGISLLDEGDFVRIDINDNGIGISSKDLPYIFDRFYRTDSSRNSSKGGSGIGLSIVRKIVEDHGGRIWAKSELGSGTDIIIMLKKHQERISNE
jgi:Signal transduction histidine kinase